jgi:integral membrane protein (TIGR01906 family)
MTSQSTRVRKRTMSAVMTIASIIIIVALAIGPLLTPLWVSAEQERAQAEAMTGFTKEQLRAVTGAILADLVIGPPDFDVTVGGEAVLNARERGHMRDVRTVFIGLWVAAAISVVVLIVAARRARQDADKAEFWSAVDRGAKVLGVAVVALGFVAVVAFDSLFSVFHQLLFPAGSYSFDPETERLVQLFPFQFWQETAIVAGFIILVLAGATIYVARRRRRAATASAAAAVPEPV